MGFRHHLFAGHWGSWFPQPTLCGSWLRSWWPHDNHTCHGDSVPWGLEVASGFWSATYFTCKPWMEFEQLKNYCSVSAWGWGMVQPSSLVESFKHLSCMLHDKVQLLMCAKPTYWKSSKGPSQLYESGVANWQWGKWFGSITCFWSHVSWLTEKMLGGDHMHALPKVHWPPLCTSAPAAFASVLCMLSTLVMAFGLGHRHWWFWSNTSACMVGMKLICQNDTKLLGWTSMHGAAQTDYSTLVLMWECKQLCWIEWLIFSLHWFSSTTKA